MKLLPKVKVKNAFVLALQFKVEEWFNLFIPRDLWKSIRDAKQRYGLFLFFCHQDDLPAKEVAKTTNQQQDFRRTSPTTPDEVMWSYTDPQGKVQGMCEKKKLKINYHFHNILAYKNIKSSETSAQLHWAAMWYYQSHTSINKVCLACFTDLISFASLKKEEHMITSENGHKTMG